MPPTFVSLHDLSQFDQIDLAMKEFDRRPPEHFETRFTKTDYGFTTVWAPDAAYESGDLERDGPRRRLECAKTDWRYVREGLPLDNL